MEVNADGIDELIVSPFLHHVDDCFFLRCLAGECRVALTELARESRDLFVQWARAAGCQVRIDQVGNIFARRPGRDAGAAPVLTGSHADSQPTGGKYDGIYGVLGGLEVVRALNDAHIETERPIGVVIWTNEEGSRFAPAMIASGVFAGVYTLDHALTRVDRDGTTFGEALRRIGYDGAEDVADTRCMRRLSSTLSMAPFWSAAALV
jgi:N-carbamoyl-L-amino-acid hydrolase